MGEITAGSSPPHGPGRVVGDLWHDWSSGAGVTYVWTGAAWTPIDIETSRLDVRRHPRPNPRDPDGSMVLVVDGSITDADGRLPGVVERYREQMVTAAGDWADRHGFTVLRSSWATVPPVDPWVTVPIRLECYLAPITVGVWGEVRAAMAEDAAEIAAERAAAGTPGPDPDDGPPIVHIRL